MTDPPLSESESQPSQVLRRGNRRRSSRRRPRGNVRVVCCKRALGVSPNLAEALGDVSQTGALLLLKEAIEPGQEVEVGLRPPGNVREIRILGRVVWCALAASGAHWAGVEFDKPLNHAALQDLSRL